MKGNYQTKPFEVAGLQAKPWEMEGRSGVSHKVIMENDLFEPGIKISDDMYNKMQAEGIVGKNIVLNFKMKFKNNDFYYEVTGFEVVETE